MAIRVCQSNVWAKYMVSHGWHGQEGLSEGCMVWVVACLS